MSSPDGQPSHLLLNLVRTGVHVPPKHSFIHVSGSSYHVLSRQTAIGEGKGKLVVVATLFSEDVADDKADNTGDDKADNTGDDKADDNGDDNVNSTEHDSQSSISRLPILTIGLARIAMQNRNPFELINRI